MRPIKAFACYSKDEKVRLCSSSGGIFHILAEFVLSQGGVVYGVKMSNDCYSAEYSRITSVDQIASLRGSKYIQAKIGDTYNQVKEDLLKGKMVLFTGTGCQVNGLHCFLHKKYLNLISVDVICHGVPSSALWKKYVESLENKFRGKLVFVNFRSKSDNKYNLKKNNLYESKKKCAKRKIFFISKYKDPYMRMFLKDFSLRPSCYNCIAKKHYESDLTIADFWGIESLAPEMNDGKGTSLVLVRTYKGIEILEAVSKKLVLKETSYEDAVRKNPMEYQSSIKPAQRDGFYTNMDKLTFNELTKRYITKDNSVNIFEILKTYIKIVFRKIGIRGGKKIVNMEPYMFFLFEVRGRSNE